MTLLLLTLLQLCLLRPSLTTPADGINLRRNVQVLTDNMERIRRSDITVFPHPLQRHEAYAAERPVEPPRLPRHTMGNNPPPFNNDLPPFTEHLPVHYSNPSYSNPSRSFLAPRRTLPFQLMTDHMGNPQVRQPQLLDLATSIDGGEPIKEESRMTAGEMLQLLQSLSNKQNGAKPLRNLRFGFF